MNTGRIVLTTAKNPMAARLIERYQITDDKVKTAKSAAGQWTKEQYQDYLKTEHWQSKRREALAFYSRKCYLCGAKGDDVQIDVHHNDYSRLGGELLSDLIPLCHDCHETYHREI